MGDKNLLYAILGVALVGSIVTCVMAYKLNNLNAQVQGAVSNPVGSIKNALGL
jgi:hypothetical protein